MFARRKIYNYAMLLSKPHFAMFSFEFKNSVISSVILLRYEINVGYYSDFIIINSDFITLKLFYRYIALMVNLQVVFLVYSFQ